MRNLFIFLLLSISVHVLVLHSLARPETSIIANTFSDAHKVLKINIANATTSFHQLPTHPLVPKDSEPKPEKKVSTPETFPEQKVTSASSATTVPASPTKISNETSDKLTQIPAPDTTPSGNASGLAPINKQHPRGWIAFKVEIALDGSVKSFVQVSKEDANSVNLTRMENAIQNLKMPISDTEITLLVSGPPLRIETDPELLAEYQIVLTH